MQNDKLPIFAFSPTSSVPLVASFRSSIANLHKAARYLVPPHDEREAINTSNALGSALPILSLFLMAGLARRRGTWLIRLALLPVALALTLRVSFGYFINGGYFYAFNHGRGEFAAVPRSISECPQLNCVDALPRIIGHRHDCSPVTIRSREKGGAQDGGNVPYCLEPSSR